jgi:hypothetical protein
LEVLAAFCTSVARQGVKPEMFPTLVMCLGQVCAMKKKFLIITMFFSISYCAETTRAESVRMEPQTISIGLSAIDSSRRTQKKTSLEGLRSGQRIRVGTISGDFMEGTFVRADESAFLISLTEGETQVELDVMRELWVRKRSPGKGALLGAIIGGAIGAFVVWMSDDDDTLDDIGGGNRDAVMILGGVSGGIVVGTVIGLLPYWRQCFP